MEKDLLMPAGKHLDANSVVTRHNNLVEAQYYASLQEQRLFLWAVSQIQADSNSSQVVSLSVAEFARFVGCENNSNVYAELMAVTDRMSRRCIRIKNLADGEYVQSNLANARYRKGTGAVEIEISKFLLPYIFDLKLRGNFTPLELKTVLRLGSFNAMRIYDLIKSRLYRGSAVEVEVTDLYQILGVSEKYQSRFNNFRQFVLEPACREINAGTDLDLSFVVLADKKNKRRAGSILFTVTRTGRTGPVAEKAPDPLAGRLVHAGLKPAEAASLVELYGQSDPPRLTWHLDEMARKLAVGALKNPAGWLRAGIRDDYRPVATPLERDLEAKRRGRDAGEKAKRQAAVAGEAAEQKRRAVVEARVATVVGKLSAAARHGWVTAVAAAIKADVMRQAFLKSGNLQSWAYVKWVAEVAMEKTGVDVFEGVAR